MRFKEGTVKVKQFIQSRKGLNPIQLAVVQMKRIVVIDVGKILFRIVNQPYVPEHIRAFKIL